MLKTLSVVVVSLLAVIALGVVGAFVISGLDEQPQADRRDTSDAGMQDEGSAPPASKSTNHRKMLDLVTQACHDIGGETQGRRLRNFQCEPPSPLGRSTRSVVAHVDRLCVSFFGSPCTKEQIDLALDKLNVYEREGVDASSGSGGYEPIPGPACGIGGCEKSGRCPLGAVC